ncbi:MAG: GNAT family N-acetyltransferase [archaeon]|jgi:ribosomal protein S18 acetylase RimI-like enzyme
MNKIKLTPMPKFKGKIIAARIPVDKNTFRPLQRSVFSRAPYYSYDILNSTRGPMKLIVHKPDAKRGTITIKEKEHSHTVAGIVQFDIITRDTIKGERTALDFYNLKVQPEYLQEGLFQQMYAEMEQIAREARASVIQLQVNSENTVAVTIYKKYGFKVVRVPDLHGLTVYIMEKTLK